jgi:hypothetical protein
MKVRVINGKPGQFSVYAWEPVMLIFGYWRFVDSFFGDEAEKNSVDFAKVYAANRVVWESQK